MDIRKFTDLVRITKSTACKACHSYDYQVPLPLTKEIAPYLSVLGKPKYPLERTTILRIDNDFVNLRSLLGTNQIKIKYLLDVENQKKMAEIQIAAYLSQMMGVEIVLQD